MGNRKFIEYASWHQILLFSWSFRLANQWLTSGKWYVWVSIAKCELRRCDFVTNISLYQLLTSLRHVALVFYANHCSWMAETGCHFSTENRCDSYKTQWCHMSVMSVKSPTTQLFIQGPFGLTSTTTLLALCEGNPPVSTIGFPAQRASNAKGVSMPWRHYDNSLNGIIFIIFARLKQLIWSQLV